MKVLVEGDLDLLGKQILVKITSVHKWHVTGDVINFEPEPLPVPNDEEMGALMEEGTEAASSSESEDSEGSVKLKSGNRWLLWAGIGFVLLGLL